MAEFDAIGTPIGATDPLGEICWSKDAQIESMDELFFSKNGMSYKARKGDDPHKRRAGLPIMLYEELGSKAGSEVRVPLRRNLTRTPRTTTYGAYTYGATYTMLGVEEKLRYDDMAVKLGLLKHAVGEDAPDFYEHNSSLDLQSDAEDALKVWLVEIHEEQLVDTMYEKFPYFIQQQLSVSSVAHPNLLYAGGATSTTLTTSTVFSASEAMRLRSYARYKKLNPIKIEGQSLFVVLADTFCCKDLRMDPQFRELKDAAPRGADNPIVSGAIGVFQGLLVYEYERMRTMTTGSETNTTGRIMLLGADAMAVCYGSRPRLAPRKEDAFGDRWGLAIRQVWGACRADFMKSDDTETLQQSSCELRVFRAAETFVS